MRITTFMLADHAEAVSGKLYVTGGCWNQVFAPQFPARHGHLSVAMAIQVPWTATNEKHSVEIRVSDADGVSILPSKLGGEFEVGRPPGWRPGDDNLLVVVFNIEGMTFTKAGQYAFAALVDNDELGRLSVTLLQLPQVAKTA
jgi:hypothetical protein